MEKKFYEELEIEIVSFTDEDVLKVSGFLGAPDVITDGDSDPWNSLAL